MQGEGATGCVVSPAVPCYGTDRTHGVPVVSKLYGNLRDRDVDKLNYEQYVKLADPRAEASVPILESCVTRGLPSRAERCHVVRAGRANGLHNSAYLPQNVMPAAGVPLDRGARLVRSGEEMLALCAPLFRFLQRLDRRHLTHFDIKPGNVLFDPGDKRVRVIDYGLVRAQAAVYVPGRAWEHYVYYPPEVYVLSSLLNGDGVVHAAGEGRRQLATYPTVFRAYRELCPEADADFNRFLLRLKADSLLWPPDVSNRIDVFGAGACLLEMWPHLAWRSAAHRDAAAAFARALLCPDPLARPDPTAARAMHAALVAGFA